MCVCASWEEESGLLVADSLSFPPRPSCVGGREASSVVTMPTSPFSSIVAVLRETSRCSQARRGGGVCSFPLPVRQLGRSLARRPFAGFQGLIAPAGSVFPLPRLSHLKSSPHQLSMLRRARAASSGLVRLASLRTSSLNRIASVRYASTASKEDDEGAKPPRGKVLVDEHGIERRALPPLGLDGKPIMLCECFVPGIARGRKPDALISQRCRRSGQRRRAPRL